MGTLHPPARCLVFDFGAGSGRAIMATYDGGAIHLRELHRVSGYETRLPDGPAWDIEAVFAFVEAALSRAAAAGGVGSIAVDSWGVDFGLVDGEGRLVDQPRTYRHPRGLAGFEALERHHDDIAERSGVQVLPIVTLFHLHEWAKAHPGEAGRARHFLMIADLVAFHLSGVAACEVTLARTSGIVSAGSADWDGDLLALTGLPPDIFGRLVRAGTVLGPLRPDLARSSGLGDVPVVAAAAHDTASAVLALALEPNDAFLICGSWNLLGIEIPEAPIPARARQAGLGLEGGVEGRALLILSLPGLYLLRRLRDAWLARAGQDVGFSDLAAAAAAADPRIAPIRVADPLFFDPVDVIDALGRYDPAIDTGDLGAMARALYLGLAAEIAEGLARLRQSTGRAIDRIRIGGGGARDDVLCDLIAKACGRPVVTGPVEASAVGNAIMQFVAMGHFASVGEAKALSADGADRKTWLP